MNIETKIKQRKIASRSIIRELTKIIDQYPELRFQQILMNYKIVEPNIDKFYEESIDTLNKLRNEMDIRNRKDTN